MIASIVSWILAASSPPVDWLDFLTRGGLLGGSLVVIYALLTDRLISGPRYRRELKTCEREVDLWRSAALKAAGVSEQIAATLAGGR